MKFPRLGTKTKMHPATMPGRVSGIVTFRKVCAGVAQRSAEASDDCGPSRSSDA